VFLVHLIRICLSVLLLLLLAAMLSVFGDNDHGSGDCPSDCAVEQEAR
jgi:hypothetical protein